MAAYKISDNCSGCMACLKLCPVSAISGRSKERQFIEPALCIDCGICGNICPRGAVFDTEGNQVKRMKLSERPKASVDKDICSGCGNCTSVCPKECVDLIEVSRVGHFVLLVADITREKCIGCGLCGNICNKDAIALDA